MLVLTRKQGQSILIGERIRVKVLGVHGQQVRLGIDAPDTVAVVRDELHRAVAEANREATRQGVTAWPQLAGVAKALGPAGEDEE